jgi:hypothetical protein
MSIVFFKTTPPGSEWIIFNHGLPRYTRIERQKKARGWFAARMLDLLWKRHSQAGLRMLFHNISPLRKKA